MVHLLDGRRSVQVVYDTAVPVAGACGRHGAWYYAGPQANTVRTASCFGSFEITPFQDKLEMHLYDAIPLWTHRKFRNRVHIMLGGVQPQRYL